MSIVHRKSRPSRRRLQHRRRRYVRETRVKTPQWYCGKISLTSRAVGYVALEGFKEDIEIPREFLNRAFDGDEVEIELLPRERGGRQRGSVTRIVSRARKEYVGIVEKDARDCLVVPQDRKAYAAFRIPREEATRHRLENDLKVLVRLGEWRDPRGNPTAHVVRVLGKKGIHETEIAAILSESGFDARFPRAVLDEARAIHAASATISPAEVAERRDFRTALTFTIDPADAKDFDDAISIRTLDSPDSGLVEVGVHIADVSHYVSPGNALDREAAERATSVYLVDRTIPMLPPELSDDLCSLKPDEDKLTFSALFTLDNEARVRERWFGRSIIRSERRFTYEEAQGRLDRARSKNSDAVSPQESAFRDALAKLNALAKTLKARRTAAGAIEFEEPEVRFTLDGAGRPIAAYVKERLDAHKLIEEFMLLANREVAELIGRLERKGRSALPFLYRVHDAPDPEKIAELAIFLRAIGHEIEVEKTGSVSARDLNALFERLEGHAAEGLVKSAALRAMAKAIYTTANIGHYGLAFGYYTHFTSPIRRYPDVLVHRLLAHYLAERKPAPGELAALRAHALHSSLREREALNAERASVKYKQVEYLADRIGEEYDAVVTGVTEWGIYVEEQTCRAEGMIALRSLSDDYYELDRRNYRLVGSRTKRAFSLGDRLRVRLIAANLDERTLDFAVVA